MNNDFFSSISWLNQHVKNIRKNSLILLTLSVISVVFVFTDIYVFQKLISHITNSNYRNIYGLAILYVLVICINQIVVRVIKYYSLKNITHPISKDLISFVLDNIYNEEFDESIKSKKTIYLDIITANINEIAYAYSDLIISVVNLTKLAVIYIFIMYMSFEVFVVMFVLGALYASVGKVFSKKLDSAISKYMDEVSNLHKVIEESSVSTKEVLAYDATVWEDNRRKKIFAKYLKRAINMNNVGNIQFTAVNLVKWVVIISFFSYGGYMVFISKISIAFFIAMYRLLDVYLQSVEKFYGDLNNLTSFSAKVKRIRNNINENSDDKLEFDFENINVSKINSIEFRNVSFAYDCDSELYQLKNISFKITDEIKIGIIGSSGSGKSTILKLLLSTIEPTSGEILVNNINLSEFKKSGWQGKRVFACFQDSHFFADTILNNILLGSDADYEKIDYLSEKMFIKSGIDDKGGYESPITDKGLSMSGGERQRLALIRLLNRSGDVYLLDEPTSAMHSSIESQILENIDDFVINENNKLFIVTHTVSNLENCDLILVLDNGEIVGQGNHTTLFENNETYMKLYNSV